MRSAWNSVAQASLRKLITEGCSTGMLNTMRTMGQLNDYSDVRNHGMSMKLMSNYQMLAA